VCVRVNIYVCTHTHIRTSTYIYIQQKEGRERKEGRKGKEREGKEGRKERRKEGRKEGRERTRKKGKGVHLVACQSGTVTVVLYFVIPREPPPTNKGLDGSPAPLRFLLRHVHFAPFPSLGVFVIICIESRRQAFHPVPLLVLSFWCHD
jgi:hypothetical protein